VASYRNEWKRKGYPVTDQYCDQLVESYPFSPYAIGASDERHCQDKARARFDRSG